VKGVLAGAGAAAVAPAAVKGASKLVRGLDGAGGLTEGLGSVTEAPSKLVSRLGSSVGDGLGEKMGQKLDDAGGPSGILKDTVKDALPFGGGGGGGKSKDGMPGVGKGRRMPVQQSVDIGLPIETVYNQFTQFEEWPKFMHRVQNVSQEDDCTVSLTVKIWTRKREFSAKIETQRPDERIKWRTSQGMTHTGVVTFHELGPSLTRVLVGFDVDPGGMIEKFARGARHIKRATRADLHRFKAFIETQETETGAWRGRIEDGELVEEHDPSYDEGREYSEAPEGGYAALREQDEDEDEQGEDDRSKEGSDSERRSRPTSQSGRSSGSSKRSGGSSSRSGGSSSRSGSSGGRSGSSRGRSRSSSGTGTAERTSSRKRSSSARSRGSGGGGSASSGRSGSSRTRASSGSRSRSQRGANGRG
jgi:uncharacterized membrane protein